MRLLVIFFIFIVPTLAIAQVEGVDEILERTLEKNLGNSTEGINYEIATDNLVQISQNPYDLNQITSEELTSLYILSLSQIHNFLAYRSKIGSFISVYELQTIPDFDLLTIKKILPFVRVNSNSLADLTYAFSKLSKGYFLFRWSRTIETKKGFTEPTLYQGRPTVRYLGDPNQFFLRAKLFVNQHFSVGFLADKDVGENFTFTTEKKQYGFDFYSFHVHIQNKNRFKSIVLGDYQLQIGQGLVLSGGFYLGKGFETIFSARRNHLGIRPYSSSSEEGFFRGGAFTYELTRNIQITPFYSSKNRDATLSGEVITSFASSGYHRTQTELSKKNNVNEQNYGINIHYASSQKNFYVGINSLTTQWNFTLEKPIQYYNLHDFSGNINSTNGLYYSFLYKSFSFFGEGAISSSKGTGWIQGLLWSASRKVDFSMVLRDFKPNFHTFYGNSFGENSINKNEFGLYLGSKWYLHRKWILSSGMDFYEFPTPKFLVNTPSKGYDFLVRTEFVPNRSENFYIQYRIERKEKNVPSDLTKLKITVPTVSHNVFLNYQKHPSEGFGFQTRVIFTRFDYQGFSSSLGGGFFQDLEYKKKRVSIKARVAYFNTEDYDSRWYAYEDDVWYSFSLPAYYAKGFRSYLVFQYKLNSKLSVWLRLSRTDLLNQLSIGSDLDEINFSHKTDVRMQIRHTL